MNFRAFVFVGLLLCAGVHAHFPGHLLLSSFFDGHVHQSFFGTAVNLFEKDDLGCVTFMTISCAPLAGVYFLSHYCLHVSF